MQPTRRLTGEQPAVEADKPRPNPSIWSCSRWGLPSQPVTWPLVSSYLTISPLPIQIRMYRRYVSVALSLRSPSLAVSQHPALWSSDFPRDLNPRLPVFLKSALSRVPYLSRIRLAKAYRISIYFHPLALRFSQKRATIYGYSTLSQAGFFPRRSVPLWPPWEPSPKGRHKTLPLRVQMIPSIQCWHIGDVFQQTHDDPSLTIEVSLCMKN